MKTCEVHPKTCLDGTEREYRYSFTLSLTSMLDGVGGQGHAPAALPPGMIRCFGCAPGPEGVQKISPPGFDARTVHPIASRYTLTRHERLVSHCFLKTNMNTSD
jgi:hypothetical protein